MILDLEAGICLMWSFPGTNNASKWRKMHKLFCKVTYRHVSLHFAFGALWFSNAPSMSPNSTKKYLKFRKIAIQLAQNAFDTIGKEISLVDLFKAFTWKRIFLVLLFVNAVVQWLHTIDMVYLQVSIGKALLMCWSLWCPLNNRPARFLVNILVLLESVGIHLVQQ